MKTGKLYRQVFIEGKEKNLPKESCNHIFAQLRYNEEQRYETINFIKSIPIGKSKIKTGNDDWWLHNVDWYLQPLPESQAQGMPTYWIDKDMIDFALYFWEHGEGKTATRDGAIYHFNKFKSRLAPSKEIDINTPFFGNSGAKVPEQTVTDEEIDRESGKRYYMNENTEYDKIFEEGAKWMRDKLPDRELSENRIIQRDFANIYENFLSDNKITYGNCTNSLDMLHKLYAKLFDRASRMSKEELRKELMNFSIKINTSRTKEMITQKEVNEYLTSQE
jgi:hypothetical protein